MTTTGAGDVQVLAADTSTIEAQAQAGSTATGGGISGAVAGAVAINAVGWQGATGLLSASIDSLLGTSFWTTEQPSNVTAKITDSQVVAAGALVLQALANSTINSTVSNTASATGKAIGGTNAGAAGGLVATNKISRVATAFIDDSGAQATKPVTATGAVTIDAENNSQINSNATLITSAVAATDGAATFAELALDEILQLAQSSYKPTDGIQDAELRRHRPADPDLRHRCSCSPSTAPRS